MSMTDQPRPVRLQMNTKGAWRDVLDFDCADEERVKTAAELLFKGDSHVRLRVIAPKLPGPPLMCWSDATGWRVWGDRPLMVSAS